LDKQRDMPEVAYRVVWKIRVKRWVDRMRRDRAHYQGVAIGRTLRDEIGADIAAGAGLVLDDERLAECLLQRRGDEARREIDRAAGRVGNDEMDRPSRPILGTGRAGERERGGGEERLSLLRRTPLRASCGSQAAPRSAAG